MSEKEKNNINRTELYVRLLTTHYQKIYAYIFTLVPNRADAEDLMQDVSSKMLANFDDFEEGTNFVAWGRKIAFYEILMYRRKHSHSIVTFNDPQTLSIISDYYGRKSNKVDALSEVLQECIDKLPQKEKHLIKKRYETDNSMKSLSYELGIHISTVYRLFERIHSMLIRCVRKTLAME